MREFPISLVIFGRYFTWGLDDVKEGITHRHYGLYTNLSKIFLKLNGRVFWYSYDERSLMNIAGSPRNPHIDRTKAGPLRSLFTIIKKCLNNGSIPALIVNYPHSFRGIKHLPEYLSMLLLFRILKFAMRIPILIDNIDPPIEHQKYLGEKGLKNSLRKLLWYFLEPLALKGNKVILLTESWKKYYTKKFGIKPRNISIIPCGSFPEAFCLIERFEPRKRSGTLVVLYAGAARRKYNVGRLVDIVTELSEEGSDIELIITGEDAIGLGAENVETLDVSGFRDYAKKLIRSDVAIVPYTGRYRSFTSLAKVGDYMMAGTPIISLPLLETSKVIKEGKCGYVVRSFKELKRVIKDFCEDRSSVVEFGRRARSYAEANMNYTKHARKLFNEIKYLVKRKQGNFDD